MAERARLKSLSKDMAERAVFARMKFKESPEKIDFDEELLPWVYDEVDQLWYSFDGNYSTFSPKEKREKADYWKRKKEQAEKNGFEEYQEIIRWSHIRQEVLIRDDFMCQLCGATKPTKLHIHHILKRREGGSDYMDNLITACPKCHRAADTKLYNPEWVEENKE